MTSSSSITSTWAFERYEAARDRLPSAAFPSQPIKAQNLGEIADEFDAFVFDSFGVLNVGDTTIPGAIERVEALRGAGKQLAILTNAASVPLAGLVDKYASLGFQFTRPEIISSREVLSHAMEDMPGNMTWGIAAPVTSNIAELPGNGHLLDDTAASFTNSDGFILLSSQTWNDRLQDRLQEALSKHPRPVLVGNPDVVAPREDGFSIEPGAHAHDLADTLDIAPDFFGKPFTNAFYEVRKRLATNIDPRRIAMIGDSLHTDILGGAAAGWRTVLVTDYGLTKDVDRDAQFAASGIVPDFVVPAI